MTCKEAKVDRWLMLVLAGLCIVGSIVIARWVGKEKVPEGALALLGTIVGGLITTASKVVDTVRALWTDERFGKVTDQLATASPPSTDTTSPQSASTAASSVADAAVERADQIAGEK